MKRRLEVRVYVRIAEDKLKAKPNIEIVFASVIIVINSKTKHITRSLQSDEKNPRHHVAL